MAEPKGFEPVHSQPRYQLRLAKIAAVLVRLDHVASVIINADHGIYV